MKTVIGFVLAMFCTVTMAGCGGPGEVKIPENTEAMPDSEDPTKAKNKSDHFRSKSLK